MYEVVKRDGQVVDFNIGKIADAIKKAFEATKTEYNGDIPTPSRRPLRPPRPSITAISSIFSR